MKQVCSQAGDDPVLVQAQTRPLFAGKLTIRDLLKVGVLSVILVEVSFGQDFLSEFKQIGEAGSGDVVLPVGGPDEVVVLVIDGVLNSIAVRIVVGFELVNSNEVTVNLLSDNLGFLLVTSLLSFFELFNKLLLVRYTGDRTSNSFSISLSKDLVGLGSELRLELNC